MKFNFFNSGGNSENFGDDFQKPLLDLKQWEDIKNSSRNRNVFIFKHSSRCGISSMVKKRFEKQLNDRELDYYYLHIQTHRNLSNRLAEELNIRHESPQLIVLNSERVIAHGSHYDLLEIVPSLSKTS